MTENKIKKNSKSSWALQLSFLFVFLIGGGFYAFINMNKEAHKLVGGDKYADMSESKSYNSEVSSSKGNFFFSQEEPLSEEVAVNKNSASASSPSASLNKVKLGGTSSKMSGLAGESRDGESKTENSMDRKSSSEKKDLSNNLKKRLALKKSRVYSGKGGTPKTSGNFIGTSKGDVSLKDGEGTTAKKGVTATKGKTSVMDALKKTWKTGIYGARDASKDKARGWIAQAFDNNVSSRYSLEYDENVKRQLDRIDPKSIPDYLRDQDVSKSSAKSLGIKKVDAPKLDVEATEKALAADTKYQAAKLANEASDGMLNSLFSGMDFGAGESPVNQDIVGDALEDEDKSSPEEMYVMSDPEEELDLFDEEMMDFGGDGCGEECGCTCEGPCCCLPPDYFNDPTLPGDYIGDFPDPDPTTMWV
jgi:hypothetical protein